MALSKSIFEAQNIILCQLCEVDQKVERKCLECELLMCKKCYEKIHPKFKNAKDHCVIDIKDVGRCGLQSMEPDFSNIKCHQHETQACCLYCSACELLVCPICVAEGHKGHDFIEIKDSYKKKLGQLKDKTKNIEIQKSNLESLRKETGNQCVTIVTKYEKVLQAVQNQKQTWIKAGEKYAKDMSAEVNKRKDKLNRIYATGNAELDQRKNQIHQNEQKSTEMIASKNTSFFFENIGKLLENLEEDTLEFPCLEDDPMLKFIAGNISQEMFGIFAEYRKDTIEAKSMTILVERKFTTKLNNCHYIATCQNGTVWLCDDKARFIYIYKLNKDTISKQSKLHHIVLDIQSNSDSSVLLVDRSSTLKTIQSKEGTIKDSKYNASPFFIIAVHVTRDKLLVGARSTEEPYLEKSRKVVMRFDNQGKQERIWEYDENKKQIFSSPRKLSSTNDGNIFVVDWISFKLDGRIVVLKDEGGILNTYTGHPELHQDGTLFTPSDIKQTPSDNILVCDYNTDTLHLLNSSGDFLTYLDTRAVGVKDPFSMTFSFSGTLFIGTAPETGKAKLYDLEFNEN